MAQAHGLTMLGTGLIGMFYPIWPTGLCFRASVLQVGEIAPAPNEIVMH